jgi:hypothetical protein
MAQALHRLDWSPATMASRFLWTQGVCLLIALVLVAFGARGVTAWLYSALIGTVSWLFIDGGRHGLARWRLSRVAEPGEALRSGWPGWAWMAPVIAVGAVGGWWLGTLAGDALTGQRSASAGDADWRRVGGWLAVPLAAGLATTWFFYVRSRLASVEAKVAETSRQAAEAQLRLLESQLEPHMLFNTLANLRVLIGTDPPRAQAMLDRLIAYLRATLGASRRAWHPLADEFARVDDYLALMQVRMGPRLRHRLRLPEALRALPVPPLLLQPLVENSIRHGLEPKVDGGEIGVEARAEGDRLHLVVRDTGVGLHDAGTGFGSTQVRERLRTLYGDRATLTLRDLGDGVEARIEMPLQAPPGAGSGAR